MKMFKRGCGCLTLLVALVLTLPLMVASCDSSSAQAGAGGNVVGPGPAGAAQETTWSPLFAWTPAAGEPNASGWPWGQCTWFVASEGRAGGDHRVHWSGDAWQWYGDAAAAGYPTEPPTTTPQPGWIAVFARGHGSDTGAGHVGVVVGVTGTTYTIAEAHVLGLGVIDERTLLVPSAASDPSQLQPLVEGWIP